MKHESGHQRFDPREDDAPWMDEEEPETDQDVVFAKTVLRYAVALCAAVLVGFACALLSQGVQP